MQNTLKDQRDQLFLVIDLSGNDHSTDNGMGIDFLGDVHRTDHDIGIDLWGDVHRMDSGIGIDPRAIPTGRATTSESSRTSTGTCTTLTY